MIKPFAADATLPTPVSTPPLAAKDIRVLRARAHALKPVVWIASTGLSEGLVRELDRALTAHELVKIHAAGDDREQRARLLTELCRMLGAQPVQIIGKMLIAFRPRPQPDEGVMSARAKRAKADGNKAITQRTPSLARLRARAPAQSRTRSPTQSRAQSGARTPAKSRRTLRRPSR